MCIIIICLNSYKADHTKFFSHTSSIIIAQIKGQTNLTSIHVIVLKYNFNQVINVHYYLKVNAHLHRKTEEDCILKVECRQC